MKKFVIAAVAASLLGGSAIAAPFGGYGQERTRTTVVTRDNGHGREVRREVTVRNDRHYGNQRYDYRRPVVVNHRWNRGERFDYRRAPSYRVIDARSHHLREAPRGYRWVQSGNDAVLIGITSGLVAAVLANALN